MRAFCTSSLRPSGILSKTDCDFQKVMTEKAYRLVSSHSAAELSERVTELLNKGWKLVGGPFGMSSGNDTGFYQAVSFEGREWQPEDEQARQ